MKVLPYWLGSSCCVFARAYLIRRYDNSAQLDARSRRDSRRRISDMCQQDAVAVPIVQAMPPINRGTQHMLSVTLLVLGIALSIISRSVLF